jgi:hypothetical protein
VLFLNGDFPPKSHLHRPVPHAAVPPWSPETLGRVPQIAVDYVPVKVHRHGIRCVPQYSDHFRVGARRQPHRSRRVTQIVNAQLGPPNRRLRCLGCHVRARNRPERDGPRYESRLRSILIT